MTKSVLFRLALIAVLVLAVPAGVGGYLYHTSQPDYLMTKGSESLTQGNLDQAKQMADRLQRKGHASAAHILRGKVLLAQARTQLVNDPRPFPYEGIQRAVQMILSSAATSGYEPAVRGPAWWSGIQVQQQFPQRMPSGVGDLLEALGEFTQVLDDDPWAAEATTLASECLVRLGDYRSAALALTALLDGQPDNLDAHRYLAAIYFDVNANTPLAPHLREWIRLDPNNPLPYFWLSHITRDTSVGYPEAIESYGKLLRLNLNDNERATAAMELAELQIARLADYERALDILAGVPNAYQDRPSFILLRAECALGLGQIEEAKRLADDLLKKFPTLSSALLFRAKIHLQDDQPRPAIGLLEKLLSANPYNNRARQTLMLAYRAIKDEPGVAKQRQFLDMLEAIGKRIRDLQPQVANEPWNGQARFEIANLESGINHSEALAWIRYALASNPEDPRIRQAWSQLVGYQPPLPLREYQRRRQGKMASE